MTTSKFSMQQGPESEEEKSQMNKVSYASAIGSLIYATICCRPDLTHVMCVVSRYINYPGRPNWEALKCEVSKCFSK